MSAIGLLILVGVPIGGALGLHQRPVSARSALVNSALVDVYFNEDGEPTLQSGLIGAKRGGIFGNSSHCLNFLHIPKTGGTSVEAAGDGFGVQDTSLTCDHLGEGCLNAPGTPEGEGWRCCHMADGSQCSVWHVPPHLDPSLQRAYQRCETFCVVREPADRFRSQHAYAGGECSSEALHKAVRKKLHKANHTPYMDDCHLVPQVEYWRQGQDCQHVIKLESLKQGLTDLMGRFGMRAHFPETRENHVDCRAPFDKLSLQRLHAYYKEDYLTFGYPLPAPDHEQYDVTARKAASSDIGESSDEDSSDLEEVPAAPNSDVSEVADRRSDGGASQAEPADDSAAPADSRDAEAADSPPTEAPSSDDSAAPPEGEAEAAGAPPTEPPSSDGSAAPPKGDAEAAASSTEPPSSKDPNSGSADETDEQDADDLVGYTGSEDGIAPLSKHREVSSTTTSGAQVRATTTSGATPTDGSPHTPEEIAERLSPRPLAAHPTGDTRHAASSGSQAHAASSGSHAHTASSGSHPRGVSTRSTKTRATLKRPGSSAVSSIRRALRRGPPTKEVKRH